MKKKWHYLEQYIASANHRITINLIGCGGTGTHVLSNLAMINYSLIKLDRQPLFVRVWDPDIVSEHNIGRQSFSPADEGMPKAEVLVTRFNRFYGFNWLSINDYFRLGGEMDRQDMGANFMISCVDSVTSRKEIAHAIRGDFNIKSSRDGYYDMPYYWMDIGNSTSSGQIILGTLSKIKQPDKSCINSLPSFIDEFPNAKDNKKEPSCSMAEALAGQDLFVNKLLATYATHMLWELLTTFRIDYRGIYINLDNLKVSKVPLI